MVKGQQRSGVTEQQGDAAPHSRSETSHVRPKNNKAYHCAGRMGRRLITGAPALSSGPQTDHVKRTWQWKPTKEWPSVDSLNTSRDVGTALTQEDQQDTLARLATVCAKHRHTGTIA